MEVPAELVGAFDEAITRPGSYYRYGPTGDDAVTVYTPARRLAYHALAGH